MLKRGIRTQLKENSNNNSKCAGGMVQGGPVKLTGMVLDCDGVGKAAAVQI